MMAIAIRGAIDSITTRVARDESFDLDHYGEVLAHVFERATAPEEQMGSQSPSHSTPGLTGTETNAEKDVTCAQHCGRLVLLVAMAPGALGPTRGHRPPGAPFPGHSFRP
jgi:hypothetical protein